MNYIKGHCKTNLDDYDCSQVKVFAKVPNKGDRIKVTKRGEGETTLKVCGITHSVIKVEKSQSIITTEEFEPYIIVELHNQYGLLAVPKKVLPLTIRSLAIIGFFSPFARVMLVVDKNRRGGEKLITKNNIT